MDGFTETVAHGSPVLKYVAGNETQNDVTRLQVRRGEWVNCNRALLFITAVPETKDAGKPFSCGITLSVATFFFCQFCLLTSGIEDVHGKHRFIRHYPKIMCYLSFRIEGNKARAPFGTGRRFCCFSSLLIRDLPCIADKYREKGDNRSSREQF